MSRIMVNTDSLLEISNKLADSMNKISEINNEFYTTYKQIDWDVRTKVTLMSVMEKLRVSMDKVEDALYYHKEFINDAVNKYNDADRFAKNTSELKNGLYGKGNSVGSYIEMNEAFNNKPVREDVFHWQEWFIENIKELFGENVVPCVEMLGDCIAGWLTSMSESELFSLSGKITGKYDKLAGGCLAFLSSIEGIYEHYTTGKYSPENGFSAMFTYSKDASGLWSSMYNVTKGYYANIDKMLNISSESAMSFEKAFKEGTIAGKIGAYMPVLSTAITTGSTAYEGYKKYSADGSIDSCDVGSIMIESSVAGISGVIGGALSLVPYVGLPLSIGYDVLVKQTNLVENVSSSIINGSYELGRKWGNFILDYSTLDDKTNLFTNTISAAWNFAKETKQSLEGLSKVYKMLVLN